MWLQRSSTACWEQTGQRMHLVSSLKRPHELSLNSPGTVSVTDIYVRTELFKWKCVQATCAHGRQRCKYKISLDRALASGQSLLGGAVVCLVCGEEGTVCDTLNKRG